MPGLIILKHSADTNVQTMKNCLSQMRDSLHHEAFYTSRVYHHDRIGLHICDTYLDHEDKPNEISSNGDKSIICAISGEITNHNQLIHRLQNTSSPSLPGDSLEHTLIKLYELEGAECVRRLNGLFHLVLVDLRKEEFLVANDRYGLHKLYHSTIKPGVSLFAPELKCFNKINSFDAELDQQALSSHFKYNCILDNRTFYKNVHRLPTASIYTHRGQTIEKTTYWSPESPLEQPRLSTQEFIEESSHIFETVVPHYYTPSQTALSLTGGWDTRAILSVLHKNALNLPCFTFAGKFRDSFDVKIARKLSQMTDNDHHKIVLGDEFIDDIEHYLNKAVSVSDGMAKLSTCHEYFVNLKARHYGTVRLTGKYGSQVIRGQSMLKNRKPFAGFFSPEIQQLIASSVHEHTGNATILAQELPQLFGNLHAQESAVLTVRTPYMDNTLIDVLLRAPYFEAKDSSLMQKNIINRNTTFFANIPTNRGSFSSSHSLLKSLYGKYFKMFNFMDDVYNWEKLPPWAVGAAKLSEATNLSKFFNGKKEWFHYRLWFQNDFKDLICRILLDPTSLSRPWINNAKLEKMLKLHFSCKRNFTYEIDKLVSFEIWHRQHIS